MTEVKQSHPRGLKVLFFAEMWERCSFYGMRALLVLYMTKHFLFSDEKAYGVYGAYTALVYATPIFGGMLADRLLGYKKAVILGGVLMSLGHFTMAFESLPIFYLALAMIIVGNGFFKPNISTIVGALYKKGDSRRDAGFTIFYMGINIGAALQLISGTLGEKVGWHWGFGFAGVGMLFGLTVFLIGQKTLAGHAEPPIPERLKERAISAVPGLNKEWTVYLGSALAVCLAWWLVQNEVVMSYSLKLLGIGIGVGLLVYALVKCTPEERNKMLAALILILVSIVFWAFFEQAGSSINLFTDRNVNRNFFGWFTIPTTVFQSVNPLFIIIFAPIFSYLWIRLNRANKEPSTPTKFGLGIFQLGIGFGILYWGAKSANGEGQVAMLWLVLGYMFHTTGELCLSPIGLSMITKLSPKRIVALMMGTWFLATAYAQYMAAVIAKLTGVSEGGAHAAAGTVPPATETVMVYGSVFGSIAVAALVVGVIMLAVSPLIRKLMGNVH